MFFTAKTVHVQGSRPILGIASANNPYRLGYFRAMVNEHQRQDDDLVEFTAPLISSHECTEKLATHVEKMHSTMDILTVPAHPEGARANTLRAAGAKVRVGLVRSAAGDLWLGVWPIADMLSIFHDQVPSFGQEGH